MSENDWSTPIGNPSNTSSSLGPILNNDAVFESLPAEMRQKLKSAAAWLLAMGIILNILGIAQGIANTTGSGIGVYIFYALVSIVYFVGYAKVRRYSRGSKGLLIACAIVTLPMAFGIIPIMAVVTFFQTVSVINKFRNTGAAAFKVDAEYLAEQQAVSKTSKRHHKIALIIILSIFGLLVSLGIIAALVASKSSSNSPQTSSTGQGGSYYTSNEDGFSMNLGGSPTIEHSSLDVSGVSVPYTTYEVSAGSEYVLVQVDHYPSDFSFVGKEKATLDGAINGMTSAAGTTLQSSNNNLQLYGYPCAEAAMTKVSDGTTYQLYSRLILKGNDLFTIISVGKSSSDFQTFANTLNFN